MRISDWRSDVCSSDLRIDPARFEQRANLARLARIMAGDDELAGGELAAHLAPRRSVLRRENLAAADAREAEETEQAFLVIGCALGARLHLDDLALAGQHEIAVGLDRKSTRLNSSH